MTMYKAGRCYIRQIMMSLHCRLRGKQVGFVENGNLKLLDVLLFLLIY